MLYQQLYGTCTCAGVFLTMMMMIMMMMMIYGLRWEWRSWWSGAFQSDAWDRVPKRCFWTRSKASTQPHFCVGSAVFLEPKWPTADTPLLSIRNSLFFSTTNQHKFGSKHLLTSFNLPLACPLVCPNRPSLMWQKLPEAFILCFQGLHELFQTGKCRELPKHTDISPLRSKLVLTSFTVHARHCQRKNQKTASKINKK